MASLSKWNCHFAWTICSITKRPAKISCLDFSIEWLSRLLCILEVLGSYYYPAREYAHWRLSLFYSPAPGSCGFYDIKLDSRSLPYTFFIRYCQSFYSTVMNLFSLALNPNLVQRASFMRFLEHTLLDTRARSRTPQDEWSARCRGHYLTTHNKHNRRTAMLSAEFEPTIPQFKLL